MTNNMNTGKKVMLGVMALLALLLLVLVLLVDKKDYEDLTIDGISGADAGLNNGSQSKPEDNPNPTTSLKGEHWELQDASTVVQNNETISLNTKKYSQGIEAGKNASSANIVEHEDANDAKNASESDDNFHQAPAHQHNYSAVETVAATCEANGHIHYVCECGKSYDETIMATGHSFKVSSETAATCEKSGSRTLSCENCAKTVTETISALVCEIAKEPEPEHVHSYSATETVAATCEVAGYTHYECNCGSSYNETIAATGHDHVIDSKVTVDNEETITYKCTKCGDTYKVIETLHFEEGKLDDAVAE